MCYDTAIQKSKNCLKIIELDKGRVVTMAQKQLVNVTDIHDILMEHGADILTSEGMQSEKNFVHHRTTNVYMHSVGVAYLSLMLAKKFHLNVNERELVRGALLHDYFLYDWHDPDPSHRLHGFSHAKTALCNASKDFDLSAVEKDIIVKHMFPLNIKAPKYPESRLVCVADKLCAICEMMSYNYMKRAA